MRKLIAVRA